MIAYKELKSKLWPDIESLFGENGACGGCWCMHWRLDCGIREWNEQIKGAHARELFKAQVETDRAHGALAYDGKQPVGWISFGPRGHFPRLERVKAYRVTDSSEVWSINCFYIAKGYRAQGVARGLLKMAVEIMQRRGAKIIEGYPVTLTKSGKKLPAAFSWMGPLKIFEEAGFAIAQQQSPSRTLVRLEPASKRKSEK